MPVPKTGALPLGDAPAAGRAYSGRAARGKASGVRQPAIDQVEIILAHRPGKLADLEVPGTDRIDRGNLRRAAGQEALLEALQLLGPDRPLDHLDAATAGEIHPRLPGDPVEEAVRRRRVEGIVAHEEDVGAGPLGDLAAPV